MEIIFNLSGDILVAELLGEMDHHCSEKVRDSIDEAIECFSIKSLIFDFGKVTFMDSSGIGVVLGRYKKMLENGGSTAICSCSDIVKNIMYMSGIFSIMNYYDTPEKALEIFRGKEVS